MRCRRSSVAVLAISLALAACGGGVADDDGDLDATTNTTEPGGSDTTSDTAPEDTPDDTSASDDAAPDESTADETGETTAPDEPEPDEPEQVDGEIVLPDPEPGPVPDLPVSPASAEASPFPEIAIRRLNGEGGWVQFKDLLPSEQPLLLWFWAPF